MNHIYKIFFILLTLTSAAYAHNYWADDALVTSHRLPLPPSGTEIKYIDLDEDGDPDVLRSMTIHNTPVQWIDDDDDMQADDLEGDTDNDCLMIDRDKDGRYGHEFDLIIDWNDEDGDGNADMQVVVDNPRLKVVKGEGWGNGFWGKGNYMWVIDLDQDNIFNYINWKTFHLECWDHSGQSRFFEDYQGQSLFIKIHAPTFAMDDVRYSWENPFLFYDEDEDGLSEMAIRFIDTPIIDDTILEMPEEGQTANLPRGVNPSKKINWVSIGLDLDNDSSPANEFDFDMSLRYSGPGFPYEDQIHTFKSMRGLPEADQYFYDPRWRQVTELIYPDHEAAWDLIHQKGEWDQVWFVYDEDDDCHRWERVEFYDPKNPFKIGAHKGGLDNNPQADCSGDRGEWDTDNSGHGKLYIGFDGRLHLYGAEWGAWRIDQDAHYYQGWQGWRNGQETDSEPDRFATILYEDTNENGFLDQVEYDLNGDHKVELSIQFESLGIEDVYALSDPSDMSYPDFLKLHERSVQCIENRTDKIIQVANKAGMNLNWYAEQQQQRSIRETYHLGFWLTFYTYMDLRDMAQRRQDPEMLKQIDKAYYLGDWEPVLRLF
ncbi:hypothetical protein HQ585_02530 [candidate division KSB1 bacterium]|nr:hypothetical protein [candidate division KSB1 bacterium]